MYIIVCKELHVNTLTFQSVAFLPPSCPLKCWCRGSCFAFCDTACNVIYDLALLLHVRVRVERPQKAHLEVMSYCSYIQVY